jgi:hypothetical protein
MRTIHPQIYLAAAVDTFAAAAAAGLFLSAHSGGGPAGFGGLTTGFPAADDADEAADGAAGFGAAPAGASIMAASSA